MALPSAFDERVIDASGDGVTIGSETTEKVGFYGVTPVVQRATATTHTTTNVVTSASYGTLQVAQMQEVMNTLAGLGLWAS
jgi:ribosomal protein S5